MYSAVCLYSMCVLCVLCVYSFCVYIYSTNYRSLNTAGNFTGVLYSVCLYNVSVQYRCMWVQSNSMCVYTLTTGPCTLLEILQVYCTVCLYILCVYCVYNVHLYRICMCTCIHLPQVPVHCWRFYRCTDIFCQETLWRRSSGSYRSPRGRYTEGCGSSAGLSQSTHRKKGRHQSNSM